MSKPRQPRACALVRPITKSQPGILLITEDGLATHYHLCLLPDCKGGDGYRLVKHSLDRREGDPDHYDVLLAFNGEHTCECKGHLRWGHQQLCRHIASLLQLQAEHRLDVQRGPRSLGDQARNWPEDFHTENTNGRDDEDSVDR